MIRYENTMLLDSPPTNLYEWQGHTSSDGHIAPAQKQTRLFWYFQFWLTTNIYLPTQLLLYISTDLHVY